MLKRFWDALKRPFRGLPDDVERDRPGLGRLGDRLRRRHAGRGPRRAGAPRRPPPRPHPRPGRPAQGPGVPAGPVAGGLAAGAQGARRRRRADPAALLRDARRRPGVDPLRAPVDARRPLRRRPALLRPPRAVPAVRRERHRLRDGLGGPARPRGGLLGHAEPGRPGDPDERRLPGQAAVRGRAGLGWSDRGGGDRRGSRVPLAPACSAPTRRGRAWPSCSTRPTRRTGRPSSSPPRTGWAGRRGTSGSSPSRGRCCARTGRAWAPGRWPSIA